MYLLIVIFEINCTAYGSFYCVFVHWQTFGLSVFSMLSLWKSVITRFIFPWLNSGFVCPFFHNALWKRNVGKDVLWPASPHWLVVALQCNVEKKYVTRLVLFRDNNRINLGYLDVPNSFSWDKRKFKKERVALSCSQLQCTALLTSAPFCSCLTIYAVCFWHDQLHQKNSPIISWSILRSLPFWIFASWILLTKVVDQNGKENGVVYFWRHSEYDLGWHLLLLWFQH